ncbi:hypothetical protein GWK48_08490 [Metallosphaera tengchongensis]|uniref:Uncharacterized protein n=1 Tax=Metallosphaera tengchongensis TaxID=1532350 RepID=A0A6N0NW13_9CREN|nr:hypothetical protein [Metallosphaera tengchongensis]QKR00405.1 hypothetical protein GWK48_08490 [Metallosphaera tengchongensis]
MLAVLVAVLTFPLIVLSSLWFSYYRKIMVEALKFPGSSYNESFIHLKPLESVKIQINGKCVLVVNGVSSWVTIRINGGPPQKVYKIRLLNTKGEVEILNESRVFQVSLLIRFESSS